MTYLVNNFGPVLLLAWQHLQITALALGLALLVALPLGSLAARARWLQAPLTGLLGVVYTIPSLSLLVLLIPLLGLGRLPAVIALAAYAQFILVRNWVLGLTTIEPGVLEAADGMGMGRWQRFWRIEFPLALPLLLAGIRLAVVAMIGIATVAAYINAGGLGKLLFEGVTTANSQKILAGSLMVTLLSAAANAGIRALEKRAEGRLRGAARPAPAAADRHSAYP